MLSVEAGLVSFALVLVLTPLWMRMAQRLGAIDRPRGRHQHKRPTPTAGGVVIFVAVWVAGALALQWPVPDSISGLFLCATLLVLLNIYDDIRGLPPLGRLIAQLVLAGAAWAWGVRIEGISNIGGVLGSEPWVDLGRLSAPVTVLWIVLVTNALNWLDGLDGLAAGVAGISAVALAVMGTQGGHPALGVIAAAMAGACLGFLRYNFAPARVFMGDTGAMFLGFMLGCLAVLGPYKGPTAATVFLPILVLGVPLYDSMSAIFKRLIQGRNPLIGDRSHIHHRLVDRGLSIIQAVLLIYSVSAALCAAALWLWSR